MAKDKAERYQSADELLADLRSLRQAIGLGIVDIYPSGYRWAKRFLSRNWPLTAVFAAIVILSVGVLVRNFTPFGEPPIPERKMIVVLPFENLGPPEDEYFADGITEELMAKLASIGDLGVIARTSAMQYKETNKTIRQIGEELGVEYVLEGTIRWQRTDGQSLIRVTPQLIRVSDETHLWAEVYEKNMTNIFQVQSEIATRVVENLDITLLGSEREIILTIPTENPDAYQAYLRGLEYKNRLVAFEEKDVLMAIEMFQRATQLDTSFAMAYAALSRSHLNLYYWYFSDHTEERLSLARDAAQRALDLEPDLPESHLAMGKYYYFQQENDKAMEEYRIANRLRPNDDDVLQSFAQVFNRRGNYEEAVEYYEKAFELNPKNVTLLLRLGSAYMYLREYSKADHCFSRGLAIAPDFIGFYYSIPLNYLLWKGDMKTARAILEQWPGEPDWFWFFISVEYDLLEKNFQSALDHLDGIQLEILDWESQFYPKARYIAETYLLMGQLELARTYFDSARIILEAELPGRPDDGRIYSSLGITYAGLGLKEEAIRAGEKAVQLMPVSMDAQNGIVRVEDLAQIYIMVGEYDAAIDQLEYLLSIPSLFSVSWYRIDSWYDPLRDNPRFQELMAQGGENTL
jgi:serine/threonine-protein kinase